MVKQLSSYQQSQLQNLTNTTTGVVAQYNSESDLQAQIGATYIANLASGESVCSTAQQLAQTTFNRMVFRDNPLIAQNLQSLNVLDSINEVIRQMKIQGASILNMTIGVTPSAFTGTGNGVINVSYKRPLDGLVLENIFAETVQLSCSQDSYTGGAQAGNEGILIEGAGNELDLFAFDWPLGSNSTITVNAINGDQSNRAGNILTNSGFANWTGGIPNNFTLPVGSPGVNIFQENTLIYTPGSAVRLTGDGGGTLTQLLQQFGIASGSSTNLLPQTQYSFNIFMRRQAGAVGTGILTIDLCDQNGNTINDNNGVANSFTVSLPGLTTTYASFLGVFRTPTVLPTTSFLRMRLTTALSNGASVYLDKASLGITQQLYKSGPYFATHSGSINFVNGDYGTCIMTNSRGAAGTLATFQTLLARLLAPLVYTNEILFPSSPTPTISDSVLIS